MSEVTIKTQSVYSGKLLMSVQAMYLDKAFKAVDRGKIQDAKTISALYYLAMHQDKRRHPSKGRRRRSIG